MSLLACRGAVVRTWRSVGVGVEWFGGGVSLMVDQRAQCQVLPFQVQVPPR